NPTTNVDNSQVYNGTAVATGVSPALSIRSGNQGVGTIAAGGFIAGRGPQTAAANKTEEFVGETTAAAAVKTID